MTNTEKRFEEIRRLVSPGDALQRAAQTLLYGRATIPGMMGADELQIVADGKGEEYLDHITATWRQAFSVECTLNVQLRYLPNREGPLSLRVGKDALIVMVRKAKPSVEYNWASMSRDVLTALASASLYQQCISLGAAVECGLREMGNIGTLDVASDVKYIVATSYTKAEWQVTICEERNGETRVVEEYSVSGTRTKATEREAIAQAQQKRAVHVAREKQRARELFATVLAGEVEATVIEEGAAETAPSS